jgi:hypothetical protein
MGRGTEGVKMGGAPSDQRSARPRAASAPWPRRRRRPAAAAGARVGSSAGGDAGRDSPTHSAPCAPRSRAKVRDAFVSRPAQVVGDRGPVGAHRGCPRLRTIGRRAIAGDSDRRATRAIGSATSVPSIAIGYPRAATEVCRRATESIRCELPSPATATANSGTLDAFTDSRPTRGPVRAPVLRFSLQVTTAPRTPGRSRARTREQV